MKTQTKTGKIVVDAAWFRNFLKRIKQDYLKPAPEKACDPHREMRVMVIQGEDLLKKYKNKVARACNPELELYLSIEGIKEKFAGIDGEQNLEQIMLD